MNKDRNLQFRDGIVKRPELFRVQRQSAHLRRDRHSFQLKITDGSLQLVQRRLARERRDVGQTNEAPRICFLNFRRTVIEQMTILQRRVPSQDTSLDGEIDASPIHVLNLRVKIEELAMDVGLRNTVLFDDGSSLCVDSHALRQLDGNIVMFKIDDHEISSGRNYRGDQGSGLV